jgi:hypothetical protein
VVDFYWMGRRQFIYFDSEPTKLDKRNV